MDAIIKRAGVIGCKGPVMGKTWILLYLLLHLFIADNTASPKSSVSDFNARRRRESEKESYGGGFMPIRFRRPNYARADSEHQNNKGKI
jgi:hypothetical protein